MHNPTPKKKQTMIITAQDIMRAPSGHKSHITGCGVHQDKRTRRCRTRSAQNRREIHGE